MKTRLRKICIVLFFVLAIIGISGIAHAASKVVLTWDANNWTIDPDLAGYKVYYGLAPGSYTKTIDIGLVNPTGIPTYTVEPLADGTYFFVVTAYDTSGNESGFSNEVTKKIDSIAPAPRTGLSALIQRIVAAIMNFFRWFA